MEAQNESKTSCDFVGNSGHSVAASEPVTNWDEIYAVRRTRERIKDRRIERERERGFKRPRRPSFR